ncbi:MAG: DUF5408 family protein [Helicobacter sp.]|nr:DUF5408 family protein [Helicobacter sp.]
MNTNNETEAIALRAVKIAIVACILLLCLGSIGIWIMMNQIAATGQMSHKLNNLEQRLERLEQTSGRDGQ